MQKKLIQRYLPDPNKITKNRYLKFLGRTIYNPMLWHLNRRSVAKSFFVGVLCAFIPIPFQMVVAAAFAVLIRCNLPISIALVWITNPLTMPVIFYFTYKVGCLILGMPAMSSSYFNIDEISHSLMKIGKPLFIGSFFVGFILATLSYIIVRILWRISIINRLKKNIK